MGESEKKLKAIDPAYNNTSATVVDYLETLYGEDLKLEKDDENTPKRQINFDAFGTEHASFLLGKEE